jgi:hypothetical protein
VALAKYRTREFKAERQRITEAQGRGEWLLCVQPECLHPTRDIAPSQPAHVAHDDSGTVVLGPAHELCNTSDGGKRRHAPAPARRWSL